MIVRSKINVAIKKKTYVTYTSKKVPNIHQQLLTSNTKFIFILLSRDGLGQSFTYEDRNISLK